VKEVLDTAYYNWAAGLLQKDFIVKPATAKEYAGVRNDRPEEFEQSNAGSTFNDITNLIKWVVIGSVVVGVVYIASKF
jgi:hypothetical protein